MALSTKEQQVLSSIEEHLARAEPELAAALRAFGATPQPRAQETAPPAQRPVRWRRVHPVRVLLGGLAGAVVIATAVTAQAPDGSCPREGIERAHAVTATQADAPNTPQERPAPGGRPCW